MPARRAPAGPSPTPRPEWAASWPLPLVSMLGYTGGACFAYSSGVFMEALTGEFGWSRAQFSTAFTVQTGVGLVTMPLVGRLVDRVGARKVALAGIVPFVIGLSLLSQADGAIGQWWTLCFVQALFAALVGSAVWVKPVVGRFSASRGLALAVVLAGSGVGTAIWPILAAFSIGQLGWRASYPAMGLGWALLMLPLAYFCFFGSEGRAVPSEPTATRAAPPLQIGKLLRSRTFVCLALAGASFSVLTLGLTLHMVPILQDSGHGLQAAAGVAGLAGVFAIIGRLSTGFLLDLLPTRPLAVAIFLLPIPIALLLWQGSGSLAVAALAVAILGFVSGADGDVVAYLVSRRFDEKVFASLYSVMTAVLAVSSSLGPILAGLSYDRWGSYEPYFLGMIPLTLFAATLVAAIPTAPVAGENVG